MLADLDAIKAFAVAHGPEVWPEYYPPAVPVPMIERRFLEGDTIGRDGAEVSFDYGDLDLVAVCLDADGQCRSVYLAG